MSTEPLTREQACDKFIADNQFRMVAPSTKMQSADSFRAGWSERDAEVARLRAACEHVFAMIEVELYESPADDQWHIAAATRRHQQNGANHMTMNQLRHAIGFVLAVGTLVLIYAVIEEGLR